MGQQHPGHQQGRRQHPAQATAGVRGGPWGRGRGLEAQALEQRAAEMDALHARAPDCGAAAAALALAAVLAQEEAVIREITGLVKPVAGVTGVRVNIRPIRL